MKLPGKLFPRAVVVWAVEVDITSTILFRCR
jgi:hypothetical protein